MSSGAESATAGSLDNKPVSGLDLDRRAARQVVARSIGAQDVVTADLAGTAAVEAEGRDAAAVGKDRGGHPLSCRYACSDGRWIA